MVASRAGIRLAFVAALQYLSARQRAVLILRDVLELPAAEVADLLGTTTTAVNSGLRRARAQLAQALPAEEALAEPAEPDRQALLERFAAAIEQADAGVLAALLREDVALEMPPLLTWFAGRQAVVRFVAAHLLIEPGWLRRCRCWRTGSRRSRSTSAPQTGPITRTPCWCSRSPGRESRGSSASRIRACSDRSACRRSTGRIRRSPRGPAEPWAGAARRSGQLRARRRRTGQPQLLSRPTPCAGWDLEQLLDHLSDSMGVLHEALTAGRAALQHRVTSGRGLTRSRACAARQPGCSPPTPLPSRQSGRSPSGTVR